jgi:16S rRNA (uracil1498-N3)-methyltransferase
MHVFFAPDVAISKALPQDESFHAIQVLRLRKGATIFVIDGLGGFYEARLLDENPKNTSLEIIRIEKEYGHRPYRLHMAVAPTKNMVRFEFFLEKTVEIGIDEITPLVCEHSERFRLRMDRLERVIISSMKQSYQAFKPIINPMTLCPDALNAAQGTKLIAHCRDFPRRHIKDAIGNSREITLFIGPEGDFSTDEVIQAMNLGFIGIDLGSSRMRTETAGVVACYATSLLFAR